MLVKTIRRHDNTYGDKYEKFPGKQYDHPSPRQLIKDGIVEEVDGDDEGASRRTKGSRAGADRAAEGDVAERAPEGAEEGGATDS